MGCGEEVCGAAGGDLRFVGRRFVEEVCGVWGGGLWGSRI